MNENSKCTASIFNKKVGGKWKLTIIYNLRNKDLRFGQLANLIEGISRKVLTDHLKQLEVDNLIKRESFNESPPRVVYSLTESAKALQKVLYSIDKWVVEFEMK
ncbi:MAG: helix-turn-helix domain-containing protein [Flavobacteriales bacterium]|nr:helix-turn-helix domain-containing protein [Flavobacteriales bacterium]